MAGAMWSCSHLGACSMHTIQPCASLQCHLMQNHIHRVHVCLAVTCHLHFWQNDQDLLTWVWHRYQNKSQHRKLTLEKKILPPLMPGLKPRPFSHESGASPMSYHCCQGVLLCMCPYTKEPGWTIWTRLHMCWLPLPRILHIVRKPVKNEGFESFFLVFIMLHKVTAF